MVTTFVVYFFHGPELHVPHIGDYKLIISLINIPLISCATSKGSLSSDNFFSFILTEFVFFQFQMIHTKTLPLLCVDGFSYQSSIIHYNTLA